MATGRAIAFAVFWLSGLFAQPFTTPDTLCRVRFSPDGRHILAQYGRGIAVLTAYPLALSFVTPALDAAFAEFTPDSREIVFADAPEDPHFLERWSVETHARLARLELPHRQCKSWAVSPNGDVFACNSSTGTLSFVEIRSGRLVFERQKFARQIMSTGGNGSSLLCPDPEFPRGLYGDRGLARISFSTDNLYAIAVPLETRGEPVMLNLQTGTPVSLGREVRRLHDPGFLFVGPSRLLVSESHRAAGWTIRYWRTNNLLEFLSGQSIEVPRIPADLARAQLAADPDYVIISSPSHTAALDYRTGRAIVSSGPAIDIVGRSYVTAYASGRVALHDRTKGLQASLTLN